MACNKGSTENVFCQRALSYGNFPYSAITLCCLLEKIVRCKKMESATKPVDLGDCGKRWEKRWHILRVVYEEGLDF